MLDLRMYGSDIWFDNQWSLRHLPPETERGTRPRQDIFRWLYRYRKMGTAHADRPAAVTLLARAIFQPVPRGRHHQSASA